MDDERMVKLNRMRLFRIDLLTVDDHTVGGFQVGNPETIAFHFQTGMLTRDPQ